ncbi:hypothetical protein BJL95_05765 [Methylomonas sp. LWB]|uniref:hypothetical protein n=1 Tax=Methylomonas sp. LWB TaxID=1905845 RepID=UPI000915C6A5|nr:hypothetical protein [Methylomonas sp. LWB]OHX34000.1 hypothetical protein BJL95_05765 [Methylomonas sp. LWB]
MEQATAPTLDEFKAACRDEFGFLQKEFGFIEIGPTREEYSNLYEVNFEKDGWRIVVAGYSYGFSAGIDIRNKKGISVPFHHLVPDGFWEANRQGYGRGQIGDIRFQALCLKRFGTRFLNNDWSPFQLLRDLEEKCKEENTKAWEEDEREWAMKRAIEKADKAFKAKRYSEAADNLSEFKEYLPPSQAKKLAICLKRRNANK